MGDLGLLTYYLGMEVKQNPGEFTLSECLCNQDSWDQWHERVQPSRHSNGTAGSDVDVTRYRSIIIRSLRYLVNTRPDLAHSVGVVSRFMQAPKIEHWALVKRIVRYKTGTINYGCRFVKGGNSKLKLLGHSDSGLAGDLVHHKSTTWGCLFSWTKPSDLDLTEAKGCGTVLMWSWIHCCSSWSLSGCVDEQVGGRTDRRQSWKVQTTDWQQVYNWTQQESCVPWVEQWNYKVSTVSPQALTTTGP